MKGLERQSNGGRTGFEGVADAVIAETAADIQALHRTSALNLAAAVGSLIVARFFQGRPELWRSHRPDKEASLRKLADLLEGSLTLSMLRRCVRVHLVSLEHPQLAKCRHVTASHADELYGVDSKSREWLLERTERERWSVITLRRAKRGVMGDTSKPQPGRPAASPESKAARRLSSALVAAEEASALLDAVAAPEPRARQDLVDALTKLADVTRQLLDRLETEKAKAVGY